MPVSINLSLFCFQIFVNIVEEAGWSKMIPHEVCGAHFVSWNDSIFSGAAAGVLHQ